LQLEHESEGLLGTVHDLFGAFMMGTMGAAIKLPAFFHAVSDNATATMLAERCQHLDGTFEAIKSVSAALHDNLE
jgi:hypothetical protein